MIQNSHKRATFLGTMRKTVLKIFTEKKSLAQSCTNYRSQSNHISIF